MILPDGRLLVAGGESIQPMPACMAYGTARLQADGTVLIVGSDDVYAGGVDMGVGIVVLTCALNQEGMETR